MADTVESRKDILEPRLRLVAWEITRRCNLYCAHCRASAEDVDYGGELSTDECFRLIDQIVEVGKPILILTGGEPLCRPDVFDIGRYAAKKGLRVVLGTNGTLIDDDVARRLKQVPVSRVGVSIDFPGTALQDEFRGKRGAFDEAVEGIKQSQRAGIEVQINSTITKKNAALIGELLDLALELGAVAFHPFMLVPTGRGKDLADIALSAEEHERVLNWIYDKQAELGDRISFKPTDAPHYMRIAIQRRGGGRMMSRKGLINQAPMEIPLSPPLRKGEVSSVPHGHHAMGEMTRGCLAGTGFCFISHVGRVQGCGYLDVEVGNVRDDSFDSIWSNSEVFERLRDLSNLKGKCGVCEFKRPCGGCRARAYEATGDYLEAEPYCIYQPKAARGSEARPA
ncbi:MAG: radical SAM protein [Chloroflexota bacterium]|nr:radical SAM protein [Chloroflexota bacterium]